MSLEKPQQPDYLKRDNSPDLAYVYSPPAAQGSDLPVLVFLGGFRSDMAGTKALYLEEQCRAHGQGFMRFDYRGHGKSGGAFTEGTVGLWKEDMLAVIDAIVPGKDLILAGSSMGGWIALLVALERPDQVRGVVGIAAAPDFTRAMYNLEFDDDMRRTLDKTGQVEFPNEYSDEPYIITKKLIEDGKQHCILERDGLSFAMPLRLVQGMKDDSVPWQTAYHIKNAAPSSDIEVFLVEKGDHRLSAPDELKLIARQAHELSDLARMSAKEAKPAGHKRTP